MRTSSLALPVTILLVGGLGGWFLHHRGGDSGDEEAAAVAPEHLTARVRLAKASQGPFDVTLRALGTVRGAPAVDWQVTASVTGRVAEVPIVAGMAVQKSQVLVRFADPGIAAARIAADAAVVAADAELAAFARDGERLRRAEIEGRATAAASSAALLQARIQHLRELRGDGLVAERTLAEAEAEAARAERDRQLAQAELDQWQASGQAQARQRLELAVAEAGERAANARRAAADLTLVAPADAVVAAVAVAVGEQPAPGTVLARLLLGRARSVDLAVAPRDLARVHADAAVVVRDGALAVPARIEAIAPNIDPTSGMVRVRATVVGDDQPVLLDGQAVAGDIVVEHLDAALLVPTAAIVRSDDALAVLKVGPDGIAHVVPVEILARTDDTCAVRGELVAGDAVVVDGAVNLPDGARVVDADQTEGTGAGR